MTEIPKIRSGRPEKWGKFFRSCEKVGDSFFIPNTIRTQKQFGCIAAGYNNKLKPMHFVLRAFNLDGKPEAKDGLPGFRVWRDK